MVAHDALDVALVARAAAIADGRVAVQPDHRRSGQDPVRAGRGITALDLVLKVGNNAWRAISDLFMYTMIVFGVYLVIVLIRWPIERAANARRERKAAADAALAAEPDHDDEPFRRPAPVSGMRVEPRL